MKTTVLVIEDDNAVRNLITTALSAFGYKSRTASTGSEAVIESVSATPDLFILDLGLPDMDGTDIIKIFRKWTCNPIIVVSARAEISDKIKALDAGADDYLTKPFSIEELMARIRAALRKSKEDSGLLTDDHIFLNGGLKINYSSNCVWVDDELIHLTPIEYKLLRLFSYNVDKVLTHSYILKKIWNSEFENDTQSLRVFIASLRKKIEKDPSRPLYLHTHIGVGYRLVIVKDEE